MKHYKIVICMMIAIIMAMSAVACGANTQTTAPTTTPTTAPTTAGAKDAISIKGADYLYTVIYDDQLGEKAVTACEALGEYLDKDMAVKSEQTENGPYEILVGMTNRPESAALSEGLGMFDYRIAVEGEKLVIVGGCDDAIINAIAYIVHKNQFMPEAVIPYSYDVFFDGADNREEYIANPMLFLCNWALEFDVPEWLTDYEEKKAAFQDPDGRMMSSLHRADGVHYPENSLEAVISAIKMGIDNIEIDLHKTKDNVLILMHDATLTDTTDWKEKAGKNGLPESNQISDWTLEELRQLRLVEMDGTPTDYLVPTLEEVLMVCKDHTTLRLDKMDYWDWSKDIYPLLQKTGAYDACILHQQLNYSIRTQYVDLIKQESGRDAYMFYSLKHEDLTIWESKLNSVMDAGYYPIVHYAQFKIANAKRLIGESEEYLALIKDRVRIYVDANILSGGKENEKNFDFLYESGIDFILVDNGLALQKYIAEKFQPTEH